MLHTRRLCVALQLTLLISGSAAGGRASAGAGQASAGPGAGQAGTGQPFEDDAGQAAQRLLATRARPEGVVPLLDLLRTLDRVPLPCILGPVRQVVDDPRAEPLVAAHAAMALAELREAEGDREGAARLRAPLGLLSRFAVLGPFEFEARSAIGVALPPEAESAPPTAGAHYQGRQREISWRPAGDAIRRGALLVDGLLRPDADAVAYVATWVKAGKAVDAALRLGSGGPVKVWWNGEVVLTSLAARLPALDQDAVGVHLRRGWNRLLVKTAILEGPWRLWLRLTDPAGHPLSGIVVAESATVPADVDAGTAGLGKAGPAGLGAGTGKAAAALAGKGASGGRTPSVRSLSALLRERVRVARPGEELAAALTDLGRYQAEVRPGHRDDHEAEVALLRAVAAAPTVARLRALAEVHHEDDGRRAALEQALALAGPGVERARVLAALGDAAHSGRREAVALARWRQALAADPRAFAAALALASEEQSAGMPAAALARVDALPAPVKALPQVARERARLLETVGRPAEAEAVLLALLPTHRQDVDLLRLLAGAARARGDGAASLALLREMVAVRPDVASFALDAARSLEGGPGPAEALLALDAALARLPDEPRLAAERGKLLHRMGRRDEAAVEIGRALSLRPQDAELRRYAAALAGERTVANAGGEGAGGKGAGGEGAGGKGAGGKGAGGEGAGGKGDEVDSGRGEAADDLARRFTADAAALAAAAPAPPGDAVDPALVLLDRRVVRVHPSGLSETFAERVVQVASARGAREQREFYIRYTPGSQEVDVRRARVLRRGVDGQWRSLEATARDDVDLSEPWYGMYYDNRAEVVRFESLRPGDVVDIAYTVADVASKNELADYFGDLQLIGEAVPKRRWEYVLIGPTSRAFHFNRPRLTALERSESREGDQTLYRFSSSGVPRVEPEPAMPGWAEVVPYLHVSTYQSWDEVGAWYWRLVADQLRPDDSVRQAARAVVKAGMSDLDKVRAIHALVVTGTRYVGLEFGIHGFKPYRVSQVLARRFGDCKDKASLMVAMLGEVGVPAEMVLVRTRHLGRLDPAPASLAVFDHAIAYVPALDLYLDGTAEWSGPDELPSQDQGVMVLRVGPAGVHLAETPILASSLSRVERRWDVAVADDGGARLVEDIEIRGQAAPEWREHYQAPGERRERFGKAWSGRFPGAALDVLDMPGIDDRGRPVRVHAEVRVPHLGEAGGAGAATLRLSLPAAAREPDLVRGYARLSARRFALQLGYPWQHAEDLTYHLPDGWSVDSLPASRDIDSTFGHFRLSAETAGPRAVRVRSALDVRRHRVAADEYAAFRRFLGEIDAALGQHVVLSRDPR